MKIEFLDDITDDGQFPHPDPNQLVRIYDFDNSQATMLRQIIQREIIENNKDVDLTALAFIQSINCNLTLAISDADKGIVTSDNKIFFCMLTIEKYKKMIFLIEPFCNKVINGYQWLYDLDTEIDFLFSTDGAW